MQRDKLLELSVLSYHRLSPKQVSIKRFTATGGTLGRSEQADWHLPDPERVVSGTHAEITYRQGNYYIVDKSTNGLFVNRAIDALGNNSHQIQSGDILCLGDYEIQVQLIDDGTTSKGAQSIINDRTEPTQDQNQPQKLAQITPNNKHSETAISSVDSGFSIDQFTAPAVATAANSHRNTSVTNNSHTNRGHHNDLAMDDHYLAPAALIPDDWNSAWATNSESITAKKEPTEIIASKSSASIVENKSKQTAINHANEQSQLEAFLSGLGVADLDPTTLNTAQWQQLGSALQQSILGLIDVMRARSNVKNSFRVNQTTFQQRENNPLKFSASMDEAFHNLFNRPSSSFMPAKQAIAEAFTDIAEHEAAMLAGVAGISSGLLVQLAPQQFEQADFSQSFIDKINPAQRQARLWQHYRLTHSTLTNELKNTSNGGVNDDFIRAYEQYLATK